MKRFIVATHNQDKLAEIKAILAHLPFDVLSLDELGIHDEVEELGATFAENAMQKALAAAKQVPGEYIMADDSGLAVDALGGKPGIYSARYGGRDSSYPEKIKRLWSDMAASGNKERTAQFICAVAVIRPDKTAFSVEGVWCGEIAAKMRGENGFGYDPVFWLPEFGKTSAELDPELKNRLSHRGRALRKMVEQLEAEQETSSHGE